MSQSAKQPIRILVVEDARVQRRVLIEQLRSAGDFAIVGVAGDGKQAIAETQRLRPQVIAMEIDLPILDGYDATRQIMRQCPTPIVLISNQRDPAPHSIEVLATGALAVVPKPTDRQFRPAGEPSDADLATLLTTLRLMSEVRVVTRYPMRTPVSGSGPLYTDRSGRAANLPAAAGYQVLAIAASTGGPAALQIVLQGLGAGFPLPILIVQHITRGFVGAFVEWLGHTVPFPVSVATQHERLQAGHVYIAPEDYHLLVRVPGIIQLQLATEEERLCPCADLLFESVAKSYGASAIGLILTGMGDDGTRGMQQLYAVGASTLAQDAASAVVYGMPRAAIEAGVVGHVAPLTALAGTIQRLMREAV